MGGESRLARQADLLEQALVRTARSVDQGRPADRVLQGWFRGRKFLGSRDRRFLRDGVFSCWRRYGWLSQWEDAPILKQAALAWRLQHGSLPDPLEEAGKELPDLPVFLLPQPIHPGHQFLPVGRVGAKIPAPQRSREIVSSLMR